MPQGHCTPRGWGVIRVFDRCCEAAAGGLVVALLGSVALGVVTRAWNDPLAWTDELARMLMVWLAMFGWILATRRRGHVRIRFFQGLLPGGAQRGSEVLIQGGLMTLGVVAAWHGIGLVERNLDLEATSMPVSIAWLYVPLVPAGVVTAVQAAGEILAQFRRAGP